MKPYRTLGQIILGSELRLLAEAITTDVKGIYQHFEVPIDPKWFPVFYVIASEEESTVTGIARVIEHSHVSVSKIVAELDKAGLVCIRKSEEDSRRSVISLSKTGKNIVPKMQAQCEAVDNALLSLTEQTGIDLWQATSVTRRHLKYHPLSTRIKHGNADQPVKIIDYAPKYAEDFRNVSEEWITRYWELEEADRYAIEHPQQHIIDQGGAIFMCIYEKKVAGTVALIPYDKHTVELAKMAVFERYRGKGLGIALGEFALKRAKVMGARRVYLESNSKLVAALALYKKLGFVDVDHETKPSPYARCDVRMERTLADIS